MLKVVGSVNLSRWRPYSFLKSAYSSGGDVLFRGEGTLSVGGLTRERGARGFEGDPAGANQASVVTIRQVLETEGAEGTGVSGGPAPVRRCGCDYGDAVPGGGSRYGTTKTMLVAVGTASSRTRSASSATGTRSVYQVGPLARWCDRSASGELVGHQRPRCTTSSNGRRFSRSMTANGLSAG